MTDVRGPLASTSWRFLLLLPVGMLAWTALASMLLGLEAATREYGPVEFTQLGVWFASILVALTFAFTHRHGRTKWTLLWLGVIATACAMREVDFHLDLAPDRFGPWGVRFKLNWWTDLRVAIGPKILWACVAAAAGAALLVPLWKAQLNPLQRLRQGRVDTWLFAAAVVLLGLGAVMDDLLRYVWEGQRLAKKLLEESFEGMGAAMFLACVLATRAEPSRSSGRISQESEGTSDSGNTPPDSPLSQPESSRQDPG